MGTKTGKLHYCWIVLLSCCVIGFCTLATVANCMGTFMPAVVEALGTTSTSFSLYYTFLNCYRTNSQILLYILFFSLRKNLTQFYIFPLPTKPRKTLFAGQKLLHEILFLSLLFGKALFF